MLANDMLSMINFCPISKLYYSKSILSMYFCKSCPSPLQMYISDAEKDHLNFLLFTILFEFWQVYYASNCQFFYAESFILDQSSTYLSVDRVSPDNSVQAMMPVA